MLRDGVTPDAYTFPTLLKASSSLPLLSYALSLHQHTIVHGYAPDPYVASSLINTYAKFGEVDRAHRVFDQMPDKSVVPWTAILSCYTLNGQAGRAFSMYSRMRVEGIQPNSVTILSLLSGVFELVDLQCVHACVVRSGFESDLKVANSLLNLYGRCGQVQHARALFETMSFWDCVSWNSLVSGYSHNGYLRESIDLLNKMRLGETKPDKQTFASVVSVIAHNGEVELGRLVHAQIVVFGLESDVYIETTLVGMYLKFGETDAAFQLFDRVEVRDVITWTAMISGLLKNDQPDKALYVFHQMLRSDIVLSTATIASSLAACAQLGSFNMGTSIHCYVIRQRMELDLPAYNSLLTMYAKCSHLIQCRTLFDRMKYKDVVSWNAIVGAYAQNGNLHEAFLLFCEMRWVGQKPDSITVISLLQACASLGVLHQGRWVHNYVISNGLRSAISVDTALIDMYSKCGELETARKCFNEISCQDVVSWSAIIAGYGSHGKGEIALQMYLDFLHTGIKPNHIIFLSVLAACSHAGLVSEGLRIFQSMIEDFGIKPKLEHHSCLIDLLCRAGRLQEAYGIAMRMSPAPTSDVLGILLDACRTYKNVELGEAISGTILALKPENAGNYVQLAHSYASMNRWDGVSMAWMQMRSLGLKKTPGWSFIELNGIVTVFFVGHASHPCYKEMMLTLKYLDKEMKNIDFLSHPTNNSKVKQSL